MYSPISSSRPRLEVRVALPAEVSALREVVVCSVRGLGSGYYSDAQIESALKFVFGIDTTLVEDGTYFVATAGQTIAGCGGWSRRKRLYGGDQHGSDAAALLDPHTDAARIRAFFVAPAYARQGVARTLYLHCLDEARRAGFRRIELMATLPGEPFYRQMGCHSIEAVIDHLPDGTHLPCVRMGAEIV